MKIIITSFFKKNLDKLKIDENIIIGEILKYKKWISYVDLWLWKGFSIYKDYLDSKKKRLITLIKINKYYFPIIIVKKESKLWQNIHSKNVIDDFEQDFYKVMKDFENDNIYKIIEV